MHEASESFALDPKAPDHVCRAISRPENLERDRLMMSAVGSLRPVDVAHATGTDERLDTIRPDARTGWQHSAQVVALVAPYFSRDEPSFGNESRAALMRLEHVLDFASNRLVGAAELVKELGALIA